MWVTSLSWFTAASDPTIGLLEQIAKAGPVVIVLVGLILILRGDLVPGRTHNRVLEERDQLLKLALTNAQLARTSLVKAEEATSET